MIATLNGVVAEKLAELVVLDVQGVGYGLLVPIEEYGRLAVGDSARFYVYEHIRENAHDLYGFLHTDTKRLFEHLLEVNGVGPKMALNILGIGSAEAVRQAIAAGDTKFIQAASGVGKRVAERVVVDLKDKVGLASTASDSIFVGNSTLNQDEATQALIALGYTPQDAANALSQIDEKLSTEDRIKQALKGAR
ncbi:MAG TPA: Holliday junction branch migration protein RuvA [Candidatus Limnocylindria bacterium]|nr:Holliday junction branch migration protein RuvA [Candidatus Limnocylindria bacterium]